MHGIGGIMRGNLSWKRNEAITLAVQGPARASMCEAAADMSAACKHLHRWVLDGEVHQQ